MTKPTGYVTQAEFDRACELFGEFTGQVVKPLEKRIEELEQRMKYHGPWKAKSTYAMGSFVTSDGSVWHANQDTDTKPGTDSTWTLVVKKGWDGRKDAR